MKRLTKEKKQQLLLTALGTLAVLAALWFGLINWQQGRLDKLTAEKDATQTKADGMTDTLKRASQIALEMEGESAKLEKAELQMASGDLYAWIINTVRDFKTQYPGVDIPQYSTIQVGDMNLLPKFPFQQATLTVAGKAYYHDLGKFIADFENQFPYIRLQNLILEPTSGQEGGYSEKLAFRMDIVALVKPEA